MRRFVLLLLCGLCFLPVFILAGFAGGWIGHWTTSFLPTSTFREVDRRRHSTQLSREERSFADCVEKGGALWVQDRDGDGISPELAIIDFQQNWTCTLSGRPGSGFVRIHFAEQIGRDADDIYGRPR